MVLPPDTAKHLTAPAGSLHAAFAHVAMIPPWHLLAGPPRVLATGRSRHVAAVIAALIDETLDEVGDGPVRPLADAALHYLGQLATGGMTAAEMEERKRLEAVWNDVALAPYRAWNIAALAQRSGMSEGHFHRRVHLLFGRAPMAMVRQLRLERAADLLRTTTLSLSEIADRVGYGTGFALSNAMAKHLRVRPQHVRENNPVNPSTAGA